MALMLFASVAQATTPATGFERFAGCPSKGEVAVVTSCQLARITGGFFKMGNKEVPINKEITLGGGTDKLGENFYFNSKGGLSKVPLKVPGGVVGLTGLDWLTELLTGEALDLYATTELAGAPSSPFAEPAFLPIKVHLTNPAGLLGNNCYVGSTAEPIKLNLFTTVSPIFHTGTPAGVSVFENAEKTDDTFSAPGANGCKLNLGLLSLPIDTIVNVASGLPAASGTNETVQTLTLEVVAVKKVYPPEGF